MEIIFPKELTSVPLKRYIILHGFKSWDTQLDNGTGIASKLLPRSLKGFRVKELPKLLRSKHESIKDETII